MISVAIKNKLTDVRIFIYSPVQLEKVELSVPHFRIYS